MKIEYSNKLIHLVKWLKKIKWSKSFGFKKYIHTKIKKSE